jgi:acyl carrier protein
VRQRSDGELEFLGRVDDQLSIRGFRVEPAEVIAALSSHPAIESCVVVGAGSSSAERRLDAYVVAAGAERPTDGDLSAFTAVSLPDYLVPSRYVWLDRLPLTAHGKLDRRALAEPVEAARPPVAGPLPDAGVETTVAAVVVELLGIEEIGMNENFFLLGGHSMLGAQLIVRLEDLFGAEISLRFVFDHPTMAEIALEVRRQMAETQDATAVAG